MTHEDYPAKGASANGFKWEPRPLIPQRYFKQPLIFLDSGQSVDEAVFLQYCRKWLHETIVRRAGNHFPTPHVHLLYPTDRHHARYEMPSARVWREDMMEVRTIRWGSAPLHGGNMMQTFAMYEDGCLWGPSGYHSAPWRRRRRYGSGYNPDPEPAGKRRGIPIYLNPTLKDLKYLRNNKAYWSHHWRCPKVVLGFVAPGSIPQSVVNLVDHFYCLNKEDQSTVRASLGPGKAFRIPTKEFKKYAGFAHDKAISVAPNWRNMRRQRKPWPETWIGQEFPALKVKTQARDATWEEVLDATDCSIYIILSEQETIPFDAYLAAARGAIIVAPDTPLFRNIPMYRNFESKKWLYPVRDYGHNRYGWSHTEVRQWLLPRIKKWRQSQTR